MSESSKKRSAAEVDPKQDIAAEAPAAKKSSPVAGPSWSLGNVRNGERLAYVDDFKGTTLISFREFFNADDGSVRPGSKGISLSVAQFQALRANWDELCAAVDAATAKK